MLICDLKADVLFVDNQNRTPLHIAFHLKCTEIVNIIKAACPAASNIISKLEEENDNLPFVYPRSDVAGAESSDKSKEEEGTRELESQIQGL